MGTNQIRGGTHLISDLIDPNGGLVGIHAEDATFVGPAVLVSNGGDLDFQDCHWEAGVGGIEAIIWEVDSARTFVVGAVGAKDCRFLRCTFRLVGIALRPDQIQAFVSSMTVLP
jgi:hypothetical protein